DAEDQLRRAKEAAEAAHKETVAAKEAADAANALLEKEVQQRQQAQKYFESLVENVPVMVYRRDVEGRTTFMNRLGREVWANKAGDSGDLWNLSNLPSWLTPDEAVNVRAADEMVIRTGQPLERDVKFEPPGRSPVWLHSIRTPIRGTEGRITGVQIVTWDIT